MEPSLFQVVEWSLNHLNCPCFTEQPGTVNIVLSSEALISELFSFSQKPQKKGAKEPSRDYLAQFPWFRDDLANRFGKNTDIYFSVELTDTQLPTDNIVIEKLAKESLQHWKIRNIFYSTIIEWVILWRDVFCFAKLGILWPKWNLLSVDVRVEIAVK